MTGPRRGNDTQQRRRQRVGGFPGTSYSGTASETPRGIPPTPPTGLTAPEAPARRGGFKIFGKPPSKRCLDLALRELDRAAGQVSFRRQAVGGLAWIFSAPVVRTGGALAAAHP